MTKLKSLEPVRAAAVTVPRLLTIRDVAERLQVSSRTVHRLIAQGALGALHIGRSVRITEQALQAFLTAGDCT